MAAPFRSRLDRAPHHGRARLQRQPEEHGRADPGIGTTFSLGLQVKEMSNFERINDLIETYVNVVQALITIRVVNKKIYIEDVKKGQYHFRAVDFKKILTEKMAQKGKLEDYMKRFRTLQFIICETNRFTNSRYINGKTTRVITVDIEKYILLKDMIEEK